MNVFAPNDTASLTEPSIISFPDMPTWHPNFNIGVAGTLCKELGVMDVAVADQVVQHDMNTSALGDPIGLLSGLNQVFLPSDEKMRTLLCSCFALP